MEPRAKTVELRDQVKLPYVEKGDPSGVPVILLHGYADSWRSFQLVLPHLPESVHAFALTQRGHGDASRPASGYGTRDFAADVLAFMDALYLSVAVIVGGSSGGLVARRLGIDRPERTSGLVLVGTPLTLRDKPGVVALWDSTISRLTDPVDPGFVREFVNSTVSQRVPQPFIETLVGESLKVPARVWKATLQGLMEDDASEELNKIRARTLLIWGDQDSVVPRSDQEAYAAAIQDSRLLVYRGIGHAPYCEEPVRFATDLAGFVARLAHRQFGPQRAA